MNHDNSEKQYQPSLKKLEELRKQGVFLRAREFYMGITLIAGLMTLYASGGWLYHAWIKNFLLVFNADVFRDDAILSKNLLVHLMINNLVYLLPFFFILIVFFLVSASTFGGLRFSEKWIQFKGERLSPLKNLKRIYSPQSLVEVGKSLLKVVLFISILLIFFQLHQKDILILGRLGELDVINHIIRLVKQFLILMFLVILIIAFVDAVLSYYQYYKKAKMTHQETKDESKETDGNPEIKKKIRQTQYAISMQKLQKEIPMASVVITNPTHFAVALRYLEKKDAAPVIIAKGIEHKALYIRQLAVLHAIPIYESPQLARSIYYSGKVGTMIHPELYMAVALVLSYILQMKEYQLGRGMKPAPLTNIEIPEHFRIGN